ncbi:OLC1v1003748C1 [Oldenlandia corymbosa var. corymbosa]|uniref:OLC1v1003748C1 n=1 Tax=Oldenlandia corymbosa var. corymbosa TaxID=529605 RepID=A0AAV1DBC8_OLDCO|nr:OLC1v1003748C1 [Oldenlandia corymbosa var. corymbosa]
MAVAGLQNVTRLDASFHGESRSLESGQWDEQNRPSTRASSLLQMWRELEGEHVVNNPNSRLRVKIQRQRSDRSNSDSVSTFLSDGPESVNGNEILETNDVRTASEQYSPHPVGLANEHDDNNSINSEQSADLGEVERERVRQIFREWMNNGPESPASHNSHINHPSRAQWLGENERERVRIIMDWVQVNCEQRGNCDTPADEGASEINPQIKLVRDGLLVSPAEIPERKAIRKLCGRQTLLDLLARAQRDRKRELQQLVDHRPVSNFSHRNRIQSLLKGRFLRNDRLIQNERLHSRETCELGLLRQRNTVSDLREGFLSRSGNSINGSSSSSESGNACCNEDHDNHGTNQSDEAQEVLEDVYDLFEPSDEERDGNDFPAVGSCEFNATENINGQHSVVQAVERPVQPLREGEQELDSVGNGAYICIESDADVLVQEPSSSEASIPSQLVDAPELSRDETSSEVSSVHQANSPVEDFVVDPVQDMDGHETSAVVEEGQEESALDHEEWHQLTHTESNEWADGDEEDLGRTWQESIANQWDQESPDNNFREHNHMHEPHEEWHENGLQEAIDSWLDSPSGQEVGSLGRVDAFYLPEDDNVYSVELRELLSRRRVSSLLRSGFRASLDQLIQSYVERQGNTSVDWDPDGTSSSPAFNEQDNEQQNIDQVQDGDNLFNVDGFLPTDDSSQSPWDQNLHHVNWSQNSSHHQLGLQEWDVINELRMDMVRLQQRMNSMQRMLEACMDMQLELQRSVRQEVSAALNRSIVSIDECKYDPPQDESNWEYARKGICCMCHEHNIDSLLYRCGHMCACSRCAENLVHRKDKCPMCRAPVVEMVRAYSIQ